MVEDKTVMERRQQQKTKQNKPGEDESRDLVPTRRGPTGARALKFSPVLCQRADYPQSSAATCRGVAWGQSWCVEIKNNILFTRPAANTTTLPPSNPPRCFGKASARLSLQQQHVVCVFWLSPVGGRAVTA